MRPRAAPWKNRRRDEAIPRGVTTVGSLSDMAGIPSCNAERLTLPLSGAPLAARPLQRVVRRQQVQSGDIGNSLAQAHRQPFPAPVSFRRNLQAGLAQALGLVLNDVF